MLYRIINHIKMGVQLKRRIIKIQINKNEMGIVKILIQLNYIKYIFKPKFVNHKKFNNWYCVVLNTDHVLGNIKNLYRPSAVRTMVYEELIKTTVKKKSIFILSTNKGLLTNFKAVKLRVGGILVMNLFG